MVSAPGHEREASATLVPVARWAGFGGKTNPQGPGFECYTWAAGISGATAKPGVASTSHVILNHPLMAAKQGTVIDHISNGRFTLNIVCGWNVPEMDMFGIPLQSHDERYDCAEEWITIVKRLWSEPAYRAKIGSIRQAPDYRAHVSATTKAAWTNADYRARLVASTTAKWKDPEYRAQTGAAAKAACQMLQ